MKTLVKLCRLLLLLLQESWQTASCGLRSLRKMEGALGSHDVSFQFVSKCFEALRGRYTQLLGCHIAELWRSE